MYRNAMQCAGPSQGALYTLIQCIFDNDNGRQHVFDCLESRSVVVQLLDGGGASADQVHSLGAGSARIHNGETPQ